MHQTLQKRKLYYRVFVLFAVRSTTVKFCAVLQACSPFLLSLLFLSLLVSLRHVTQTRINSNGIRPVYHTARSRLQYQKPRIACFPLSRSLLVNRGKMVLVPAAPSKNAKAAVRRRLNRYYYLQCQPIA